MTIATTDHAAAVARLEGLPALGVWSPVLTPVDSEYGVDAARFLEQARWVLEQGCHGLALFGTTSEANSFSVEERMALLDAAIAGGIPADRLMVGTGCCAFPDSVRLTEHAVSHEVHRVLMLPPFYYKGMSDEGLARAFGTVIERVADPELRVFLYHFPRLTGVPVTLGLLDLLVERYGEAIAGVKDSSGDWSNTEAMIDRFPSLAIFPGSEIFLLQGLEAGGAGCITATSNVNPSGSRAVWDAWVADDGSAEERQTLATAIRRALETEQPVPGQKWLLASGRGDAAWKTVRPPMVELGDAEGAALVEAVRAAGFDPASVALG
ncbi:MAG: dihydrodipicolinate synthase family protein [Chloroflexi bacterium]|nr:dihydrodipicolinate synthase family protein [Chloroflexota bacterium]MDA1147735.1 dihydrodipicolinate synthase family protein [Chloroflexota bacterium]